MSDPVGPPPRAVLDTDVIFSRVLHELLGRIAADLRLLTLTWSDELLAEAERTLFKRKDLPEAAAQRWVGYLRDAFPEEQINLADLPANIDLSRLTADSDDHHICALAIVGRANLLLTFDRGYLSGPLNEHGIQVLDPDDYLCDVLDQEPPAILRVIRDQANVWAADDQSMTCLTRSPEREHPSSHAKYASHWLTNPPPRPRWCGLRSRFDQHHRAGVFPTVANRMFLRWLRPRKSNCYALSSRLTKFHTRTPEPASPFST